MQKSINYNNSNYAIITADNEDIDMPIPQNALKLPLPVITEDFFSTLDSVITFSKSGYLKMIFKANLVTVTGGVVDLQICVNGLPSPNQRHRFKSDTYIEVSFESEIVAGDTIEIRYAGSMAGMVFEYLPITSDFLRQPPFVISLELVNSLVATDEAIIGQIIHSTNANMTTLDARFINIDTANGVILEIAKYPKLHAVVQGTYLFDTSYIDGTGLTFKIKDSSAMPYLRGTTNGTQNDQVLTHAHSLSPAGYTVSEGVLGNFKIKSATSETSLIWKSDGDGWDGDFSASLSGTLGNSNARYGLDEIDGENSVMNRNQMNLNDRVRYLDGTTDSAGASTNEVNSIKSYRYIIGDRQNY